MTLGDKAYMYKKSKLSWNCRCILCMIPSFIGILIFFFVPYIRVLYFSLINNQFKKNFVGLSNYITTVQNEYFRLAMKNSLLLIVICVPLLMIFSLLISLFIANIFRKRTFIRTSFVLPMVIPTASIVLVWKMIFPEISTVIPIYLLFIWKNVGICVILMTAAFLSIDKCVFEAAKLDGASDFALHTRITIPGIFPTLLFCNMLSIVNTFKIYKESYLLYGTNYPPNHSYTLQYYMNNHFLKLDYQKLSTSAVLTSLLVFVIVVVGLKIQRRYSW